MDSKNKEIDLLALGLKLWDSRKLITKVSLIGLVIGVIIAFSIPKEYTTKVILAPETNTSATNNVIALATMAGINLNTNSPTGGDISSNVYPDILRSTPFLIGLSEIKVSDTHQRIDTTLFDYIENFQTSPWWTSILGLPSRIRGLFSSSTTVNESKLSKLTNHLTKTENDVLNTIADRLEITIDKKTGVISLSAKMQSPQISAMVADTLTSYLQSYIISYRTQKARADLEFTEKLYNESKIEYDAVRKKYAEYLDKNQNVILASYRMDQERLQNEVSLAYNVYNQMAQQLQLAKVKVQDQTPVYTILQPPVVPIKPSEPNKKIIAIGFTLLFALATSAYIAGKEILKTMMP